MLRNPLRRTLADFQSYHQHLYNLAFSLFLTLFLEGLGRGSAAASIRFLFHSPVTFACNMLIVFTTLSLSALTSPRQRFVRNTLALVWFICGIINCVVLRFRMTPFTAEDLKMVPSLFRIADNYLTRKGAVLIILLVFLTLAGIVVMWRLLPKSTLPAHRFRELLRIGSFFAAVMLFVGMGTKTQALSTDFQNLADAYEEYGFAYCFSTSLVDIGIRKPRNYSRETVREAAIQLLSLQQAHPEWSSESSVTPNIIMVQLESFFDPCLLDGCRFSEDPVPVMRALSADYANGDFCVPVVGAGTANTEFEVLTGMSTDFFGAGEYPYNTVLTENTAESMAHILRSYGYTSSVIHNNTGTFYHRNTVFSRLGFDRFIPSEYLYEEERTPTNWMKDRVLTDVIRDMLSFSDTPDFIYTITVQSHGRYPDETIPGHSQIRVEECPEHLSRNSLEYYINEIHEVDAFVGDLVSCLGTWDEPTVLVLYGDHLPALGFEEEDFLLDDLYRTQYVIWNNFDDNIPGGTQAADEIGSFLLRRYGLAGGIMPLARAADHSNDEKDEFLRLLEYDMLYGEGYIFEEMSKTSLPDKESLDDRISRDREGYVSSDLLIGYLPVTVTGAVIQDQTLTVTGENFNRSSLILIDGKPYDTIYLDRQTLRLSGSVPDIAESISVGQFDENRIQLGEAAKPLPFSVDTLFPES